MSHNDEHKAVHARDEAQIADLQRRDAELMLLPEMNEGAIVMLDALGFKGIWNRAKPGQVLAKMRALREEVYSFREIPTESTSQSDFTIKCECISDSIVIGVWPKVVPLATDRAKFFRGAIRLAAFLATEAMLFALTYEPYIVYRGALAFGRFDMDEGFIIGPAVDAAAMNMEQAEGAFVWFLPSAAEHVRPSGIKASIDPPATFRECDVPLKGIGSFKTLVVVPYWRGHKDRGEVVERTLLAMRSDDMRVAIKRQNTERFLRQALVLDDEWAEETEAAAPESDEEGHFPPDSK